MRLNPVLAIAGVLLVGWSATHVQGNFADAAGFSGRAGLTCTACHQPPHPEPAQAHLVGLPEAWDLDARYVLDISVTGGPPALPAPQPQGGFDIASTAGRMDTAGHPDLRQSGASEITYRPEATLRRAWQVGWTAPGLETRPEPITFYLAVVAANGNHVVATNRSDLGETFDASAALHVVVPPSAEAQARWAELPLATPEAFRQGEHIQGRHTDPLASHVAYRVGDGPVVRKATGPSWFIATSEGVTLWSEGAGRASPAISIPGTPATDATSQEEPEVREAAGLALILIPIALGGLACARRCWS